MKKYLATAMTLLMSAPLALAADQTPSAQKQMIHAPVAPKISAPISRGVSQPGKMLPTQISRPTAMGSGTSGGGDAVQCNGGLLVLFSDHDSQLTDTYPLFEQKNQLPMSMFNEFKEETVRESILSFLERAEPETARQLRAALERISFQQVHSVEELETGAKVGLMDRVFGCSREQIAVQDFDQPSSGYSTVRLAQKPYEKLDVLTRALLQIHEGFIYLAHAKYPDLKEMETDARAQIARVYELSGLDSFIIADVVERETGHRPDTDSLFPWFDALVSYDGFKYSAEQVRANVSELIGAGLDPNATIECRMPILDFAIGHLEASAGSDVPGQAQPTSAVTLIENGARVDSKDMAGRNPIHLAVYSDGTEITEALVKAGADINAPWCAPGSQAGSVPLTALDLAKSPWKANSDANAKYLKSLGAKSGKDLDYRCPDVPKITKQERKEAGCNLITGAITWWAKP